MILGAIMLLYNRMDLERESMDYVIKHTLQYRKIWITAECSDKILKQYTEDYEVVQIKTTNMGLFKLTYNLTLKNRKTERT